MNFDISEFCWRMVKYYSSVLNRKKYRIFWRKNYNHCFMVFRSAFVGSRNTFYCPSLVQVRLLPFILFRC
jgi:hypothetical protein